MHWTTKTTGAPRDPSRLFTPTAARLGAAAGVLAWLAAPALAEIIQVPQDEPSIGAAMARAETGDEVVVADGVYTGADNRDMDFEGKGITVRSANGPANCVIDCGGMGRAFTLSSGEGRDSVIDGFTIRFGKATNGAGIDATLESSPTIRNCVLEFNEARALGGGIACRGNSNALIENCVFRGNVVEGEEQPQGAGISGFLSSPDIVNCQFYDNRSRFGAAIAIGVSFSRITNCLIYNNTSERGTGIYMVAAEPVISNCTVVNNHADLFGGGMSLEGLVLPSFPVVKNSIFWNNTPNQIEVRIGEPTVTYCNVQGGWPGEANIDQDPLLLPGPNGDFYLSQRAAGQRDDSPCLDAGDATAESLNLHLRTTRTDQEGDAGVVDLGYHHRIGSGDIRCEKIRRLKVRCTGSNKLKARIKSDLSEGTALSLARNGGDRMLVIIDRKGKGKAVWRNAAPGEHEICVDGCPDICQAGECRP